MSENKKGAKKMLIKKETLASKIIDSHESRIGTLELVLRGCLIGFLVRSMLRIITEKFCNLSKDR